MGAMERKGGARGLAPETEPRIRYNDKRPKQACEQSLSFVHANGFDSRIIVNFDDIRLYLVAPRGRGPVEHRSSESHLCCEGHHCKSTRTSSNTNEKLE